ncbi:MAG: head-tail adaptor protein [Methylobacterium sp.]|uniref:phage head closure protein n=1 Tax=Bosea sp. (in: a-proteobacteria) TaxID=1871050 RepID=UPI001D6E6319|nr:phage head closure protein [Bosea sp. (in: a-proteobacteria)]MBA4270138.1 head-tail adaptor protein [Methylobacterium sp.]WRH58223.1 MAG: phage head closure protein [Bosea sp. (in: a-proteobacteria)]
MAPSNPDRARVGALRRRLLLEAAVTTPDGLGGTTQVYETVAAVWAQLEWIAGGERWRRGRPEQVATHRVTLRWRAGVDAGQRLRDGDRLFDIRAVADPDGGRRRLVCLVQEIGP